MMNLRLLLFVIPLATLSAQNPAPPSGEWRKALRLQQDGKLAEAEAACDAVPADSVWKHKARLLKAKVLADQKKHEAAEAIYAEEAARMLAPARKDQIAGLLAAFADEVSHEPAPGEAEAPPPNFPRAAILYAKALETEFLSPDFLDETLYKLASARQKAGQFRPALQSLNEYLIQFDKDWKPVAVPEEAQQMQAVPNQAAPGAQGEADPLAKRRAVEKKKVFLRQGNHRFEARLRATECLLALSQRHEARATAQETIAVLELQNGLMVQQWMADAAWLRCESFAPDCGVLQPHGSGTQAVQTAGNEAAQVRGPLQICYATTPDPAAYIKVLGDFLKKFPAHRHAPLASRLIAGQLAAQAKWTEAIAAWETFIAGKNYQFDPAAVENQKVNRATGRTPAEALEREKQAAWFSIATAHFELKRHAEAIAQWRQYTANYPNGPQWAEAQQRIIDTEFHVGLTAVAAGDEKLAREKFDAFLAAYPLEARSRQILFIYGQFFHAKAQQLEEAAADGAANGPPPPAALEAFQKAIGEWERLISKYPDTEESSLALYNTALILTEKLDRLEDGLAAFRRLTWGQWAQPAKDRAAVLAEKSLAVTAPRIFRTNETARVLVSVRNLQKLKLSRYPLDPEAWFRSNHRLAGIEKLDVDLIAPEKTWEVEVQNYARYKALQQAIDIPFPENQPGACVVRVEADDWQATTLVLRSDLQIITEATPGEILTFVVNAREGKPLAGATVLVSDGAKIAATGQSGADGVFLTRLDAAGGKSPRCFVSHAAGVAASQLEMSALSLTKQPEELFRAVFDRRSYLLGQTVRFQLLLRKLDAGKLAPPAAEEFTLRILDPASRLVTSRPAKWDVRGGIFGEFLIPSTAGEGDYSVQLVNAKDKILHRATFTIAEPPAGNSPQLELTLDKPVVRVGDSVRGSLSAVWPWGVPIAGEKAVVTLPGGKTLELKTDESGRASFEFQAVMPGEQMRDGAVSFHASIPAVGAHAEGMLNIVMQSWRMRILSLPSIAAAGEAIPLKLRVFPLDGQSRAKALKFSLVRLSAPPQSRVLEGVPWIAFSVPRPGEVEVEKFEQTSAEESGLVERSLTIAAGGHYILRVTGESKPGEFISVEQRLFVAGKEDPVGLRFYADRLVFDEGASAEVRLRSSKARQHLLLTVHADQFLHHEILAMQEGVRILQIPVAAAHAPNFRITAAAIDGRVLETASLPLAVRQGLKIAFKAGQHSVLPGAVLPVELLVTDLAGNPVEAQCLLGVSRLLPEPEMKHLKAGAGSVVDLMQPFVPRQLHLSIDANAAAQFPGVSSRLLPDGAGGRVTAAAAANDQQRLSDIQQVEVNFNKANTYLIEKRSRYAIDNGFLTKSETIRSGGPLSFSAGVRRSKDLLTRTGAGELEIPDAETGGNGMEAIEDAGLLDDIPLLSRLFDNDAQGQQQMQGFAVNDPPQMAQQFDPPQIPQTAGSAAAAIAPADCVLWNTSFAMAKDGRAAITTPEEEGLWQALAIIGTPQTGLKLATVSFATRKPLSLSASPPAFLRQGDSFQLPVTLTNRDGLGGETTLEVEVLQDGKTVTKSYPVRLDPARPRQTVLLEAVVAGLREVKIAINCKSGAASDKAAWTIPVVAAGVPARAFAGGILTGEAQAAVKLPGEIPAARQSLAVSVWRSPIDLLADLALHTGGEFAPQEQSPASSLLANLALLKRVKAAGGPREIAEASEKRIHHLVSTLALAEQDGGWAWNHLDIGPDILTTAQTWLALAAAKDAGFPVSDRLKGRVEKFLEAQSPGIPADDLEKKAAVLHAQAAFGTANYAAVAPLLRIKDSLSDSGLAWLAAACVRMDRADDARLLLEVLKKRAQHGTGAAGNAIAWWGGSMKIVRLSEVELTTAVILWCHARLQADAPLAAEAAAFLLQSRGVCAGGASQSVGMVATALAEYLPAEAAAGGAVEIFVNGAKASMGDGKSVLHAAFPAQAGENVVKVMPAAGVKVLFAAALSGWPELADSKPWEHPRIASRGYFHDRLRDGDQALAASSTSPVQQAEWGQRLRVEVKMASVEAEVARHPQYLILDEPLPAGFLVVPQSVEGNFDRLETLPDRLRATYAPGVIQNLSYELVALTPGSFAAAASILQDAYDPAKFRPGFAASLTVLPAGGKSPDVYQMNAAEHMELARLTFDAGRHDECLLHLDALAADPKRRQDFEKDLARMRLWILTSRNEADARQLVAAFETLRERYPELVIPFDRILRIGSAYQRLGEHERGAYVFLAVLEANFLADSGISAALEDQGDYGGSVEFQERLWHESPDGNDAAEALFGLAQSVSRKAADAEKIPVRRGRKKLEKNALLEQGRDLLLRFLDVYPKHDLADDADFSLANVFFALKDYPAMVAAAEEAVRRHPKSTFLGSFQYMAALGHFWQFSYDKALAAAAPVAGGESKDRDLARYITGQIYHAQRKIPEAIEWYGKVKAQYPDAKDAIAWFEEKRVSLPEVSTFLPGDEVKLTLTHRNVKEASLQVYKVDLMKLYLREKNLSNITKVNLAGIAPQGGLTEALGDGRDYETKTREVKLPLREEGAYLVICRGDDLFTSGLVLVTPLRLEVGENVADGSVRVNVLAAKDGRGVADAEVKAVASESAESRSGQTDPRGVYEAAGLRGVASVIVKKGGSQYAFHRGTKALQGAVPAPAQGGIQAKPEGKVLEKGAYFKNVEETNRQVQEGNLKNWDDKRRSGGKGVEASKAAK